MWLYHRVMSPNDADGMANSVDPDQTAPRVCSGSALFAQTCLSENLGILRYMIGIFLSDEQSCTSVWERDAKTEETVIQVWVFFSDDSKYWHKISLWEKYSLDWHLVSLCMLNHQALDRKVAYFGLKYWHLIRLQYLCKHCSGESCFCVLWIYETVSVV